MKFKDYKIRLKMTRIASALLAGSLLLSVPVTGNKNIFSFFRGENVYASSAQEKRDEAQQNLDNVQNEINNLENEQQQVQNELSEKTQVLSDLLAEQKILEQDIAKTQVEIDQAKLDLQAAKDQEQAEYEAMKLRIQYMYENSTENSIWTAILEANGIKDLLNRVEYVTQVHKTDREMLTAYQETVKQVEEIAEELDSEMNNLVAMKEVSEHQEVELEKAMQELRNEVADFEQQLAAAEARADAYAEEIAEQNRIIAEEERRRREEEERRRREEEERRRQEQERLEQQQQQQNNNNSSNSESSNNGTSSTTKPNVSGSGYLNDSSYDPGFSSSVSGEELVNYALQFVGNPYKWGGNSLTNGCDCSGFVNLIYKHFGFSVPRYSQAFKTVGKPVAYENLKAGDIVVYPGHVAIYIGNGKIVEAQSTKAGITCTRRVNCNTITAIRRVL
ncbi:MAG: C40 family peptidase [Lachnospiraceae bacterium]|nr:C40 family peptidase [Lachnospiraceae bacterium]